MRRLLTAAALAASILGVSACGGSGGGVLPPTAPSPPPPADAITIDIVGINGTIVLTESGDRAAGPDSSCGTTWTPRRTVWCSTTARSTRGISLPGHSVRRRRLPVPGRITARFIRRWSARLSTVDEGAICKNVGARRTETASAAGSVVARHQLQQFPRGVGIASGHVLVQLASNDFGHLALTVILSGDVPDQGAFDVK